VELELEPDTQVRMGPDDGERELGQVEIVRGRVRVTSERPGGRVTLRTQTVRIDSLGAGFSVSFIADDTRVEVDSGSVRLERGGRSRELHAGDHWRDPATDQKASAAASTPSAAGRDSAPSAALGPGEEKASLGEENRLFQAAMLAKRRGLGSLAVHRLDEMLAKHPRGSLSENARVERFRILARSGNRDAARSAAREYLTWHPSGFGRGEAGQLLARER
jgi:hypothetical protein